VPFSGTFPFELYHAFTMQGNAENLLIE